jgi:SnoaL-like domain
VTDTLQSDRAAIRDLVEAWVIFRDSGDWARLATLWAPDAIMNSTVFQGPATAFMTMSQAAFERGVNVLHTLSGSVIDIVANRAIAQTKMAIIQRAPVHDVVCDVTCHGRFYDFLAKRDGQWELVERQPIYEKDRIDPVEPGATLKLAPDLLGRFPQGYRHLAYLQTSQGMTVKDSMPQLRGAEVEALYERGKVWLESQ